MADDYSPWSTSASAGGTLQGTLTEEDLYGILGQRIDPNLGLGPSGQGFGMQTNPWQTQGFNPAATAEARLGEFQLNLQQPNVAQALSNVQISTDAQGNKKVKVEGDLSTFELFQREIEEARQLKQGAFAELARLKAQEARGHPILDALSTLSGRLAANDPTLPGWVRSLGQTALQMGPEGIKQERMLAEKNALAQQDNLLDVLMKGAQIEESAASRAESAADRRSREAQTLALQEQARQDKLREQFQNNREQVVDRARSVATATGKLPSLSAVESRLRMLGAPDDFIAAAKEDITSAAVAAAAEKNDAEKRAEEKQRKANEEWYRRLAAADAIRDANQREREKAQIERDARKAEEAFAKKVQTESRPPEPLVKSVQASLGVLRSLDFAEDVVRQNEHLFGPVMGRLATNPWMGSTGQKMMLVNLRVMPDALKASGLAPISEKEYTTVQKGQPDVTKRPSANYAAIAVAREEAEKKLIEAISLHAGVDWETAKEGLLASATNEKERARLEELLRPHLMAAKERRLRYVRSQAPPGTDVEGRFFGGTSTSGGTTHSIEVGGKSVDVRLDPTGAFWLDASGKKVARAR